MIPRKRWVIRRLSDIQDRLDVPLWVPISSYRLHRVTSSDRHETFRCIKWSDES